MSNDVDIKGVKHRIVTPVKALFRSDMVHDVITQGRRFVVNLETNALTIYSPPRCLAKTRVLSLLRAYFKGSAAKHAYWADKKNSDWVKIGKPFMWEIIEEEPGITVLKDMGYGWFCLIEDEVVYSAMASGTLIGKRSIAIKSDVCKHIWK